jgi:hypothetical protein
LCVDGELFGFYEGKDADHTVFVVKAVEKMVESKLNVLFGGHFRGVDTVFRNVDSCPIIIT